MRSCFVILIFILFIFLFYSLLFVFVPHIEYYEIKTDLYSDIVTCKDYYVDNEAKQIRIYEEKQKFFAIKHEGKVQFVYFDKEYEIIEVSSSLFQRWRGK